MSNVLQFQINDAMVDQQQRPTKVFQDWALEVQKRIPTFKPLYLPDFGSAGNGIANDTAAFRKAIAQAISNGGGTIIIPSGTYSIDTVTIPAGSVPITLLGQGDSTILKRRSTLAAGAGLLDIFGSNVTLASLLIDGGVTIPVGLFYNVDFTGTGANDPMAPSLTLNSSVWLHGPASNFTAQGVTWEHSGGYASLIDAGTAGIDNVRFFNCRLRNNRPHLFGYGPYAAIYGSWTGGIYVNGDGRSTNPGCVLKGFLVAQCQFLRGTGNQIWSHLYGLDELHEDFQFFANYFLDIGLDGILVGGVIGGVVSQNNFRRIGYVCTDDNGASIPRWLPNLNATALDSSGVVKGVNYQGNSFLSVNGGAMDLDGHGESSLEGNMARIPYPSEPEYAEDLIGSSGIANAGSTSYGLNLGNTNDTEFGGRNVTISGNTLINLPAGLIRLYSARDCLVTANNLIAPDTPIAPPISMGPGGPGVNQRSTGNIIKHNRFAYNPASTAPFCFEDPSVAPFTAADVNSIFGNCPVVGVGGLATEFQKDPSSGSPTYAMTIWF